MSSIAINLSALMTEILEETVSSRLHGTAVIQRARCVLLAENNARFVDISRIVQLSAKAVARWIRRFAESIEALQNVEKT
jgi:transposase-like protein